MTMQEAQKEMNRLNNMPITGYCPLAIALCRADCICFEFSKIWKTNVTNERTYQVTLPGCKNAMFTDTGMEPS